MGINMAMTINPMVTPKKTIKIGSIMDVSPSTAVSTTARSLAAGRLAPRSTKRRA